MPRRAGLRARRSLALAGSHTHHSPTVGPRATRHAEPYSSHGPVLILTGRPGEEVEDLMAQVGSVALLAPIPREHLTDGVEVCTREAKVAFGRPAWEALGKFEDLASCFLSGFTVQAARGAT